MSLFTFPLSRMEVKIVVMLRATLAGTAEGDMKKQHHERITRTIAGTKIEDMKLSVRRRNENTAERLAKEPVVKNNESTLTRETHQHVHIAPAVVCSGLVLS